MPYLVTFTPCGHEHHYNGAPKPGDWCSCWGPGRPGCQGSRKVASVRDCDVPDCRACAEYATIADRHQRGLAS